MRSSWTINSAGDCPAAPLSLDLEIAWEHFAFWILVKKNEIFKKIRVLMIIWENVENFKKIQDFMILLKQIGNFKKIEVFVIVLKNVENLQKN